jgi:hypothetical protein
MTKQCKAGYVLNPVSNICVKVSGSIGKNIIAAQLKADADAVANKIPMDVFLIVASMLRGEHRNAMRLVDKQFAAAIAVHKLSEFAQYNARRLMDIITFQGQVDYYIFCNHCISRNSSKSLKNTLLVKILDKPKPSEMPTVHIIRHIDKKHQVLLAVCTDPATTWARLFKDTSYSDMIWLHELLANARQVVRQSDQASYVDLSQYEWMKFDVLADPFGRWNMWLENVFWGRIPIGK